MAATRMSLKCGLPKLLLLLASLGAAMLHGSQAIIYSPTCINNPTRESGCELAITRDLVLTVMADVAAASNPDDVYVALNAKDPKYQFNGFYAFVYDDLGRRVAHQNTSSLGLYLDESNHQIGVPTYPNFLQNFQAIAAAGGGTTEYIFVNGDGTGISLKKSYIGPLPGGYLVGAVRIPAQIDSSCTT